MLTSATLNMGNVKEGKTGRSLDMVHELQELCLCKRVVRWTGEGRTSSTAYVNAGGWTRKQAG